MYLEYHDEISAKFWQIKINGASHTITYGKIGTQGQSKIKTFATPDECQKDADKLIRAKKKKGYAPKDETGVKPAPKQNDHQAMMDELDTLIKEGNPLKAFDFLQKYKNGNATMLKKALPKLCRHWLDWREIPMPSGKTRYGRLGGNGQEKFLAVLVLGLFSPSDYNNRYQFVGWLFNRGFFNDAIIARLQQIGSPVLPTVIKVMSDGGFVPDYRLLTQLEKAGLLAYEPVVFVSAFGAMSEKYIVKHNKHLTKHRRHKVSKFYDQYAHENKTAPTPQVITTAEPVVQGESYQGQVVPFISLKLSAFDGNPAMIEREFHDLFCHETPIASNTRWINCRYESDYHNAKDFVNPYHQWIAHFIQTGKMDKMWVLTKCLEIQTGLWADTNKTFFRQLFDHISPSDDDKLALQDNLLALLVHDGKTVINFALKHLKAIYQHDKFHLGEFLGHWQTIFMMNDNKTAIKTLLTQATTLLKCKGFAHTDDVLFAIMGAFLVNDVAIQEKTAKLIAKYADHASDKQMLTDTLTMYAPTMHADSQAILAHLLTDVVCDDVGIDGAYVPEPAVFDVGERVERLGDFYDVLFAISTSSHQTPMPSLENILASYLSLMDGDKLPDDAHEQLKTALKGKQYHYSGNRIFDIFIKSWYEYVYHDGMISPKDFFGYYDESYKIHHTWYNVLRHFYHLIKQRKQGTSLPLVSTPTHTSGAIEFGVFVERLVAYQKAGVGFDFSDVALAMARTSLGDVGADDARLCLDDVANPYLKEILLCHFGLSDVPQTTPPLSWLDKNADNTLQKLGTYFKEKLSAQELHHQNHFDTDTIKGANWQAWRGLWAVAVLTHRTDVHLTHHHDEGRVYDQVVQTALPFEYEFKPIKHYDYQTKKTVLSGKHHIRLKLPPYFRWSATSDIYRRQYYHAQRRWTDSIYSDLYAGVADEVVAVQSMTPYQPVYIDATIAHGLLLMSETGQVSAYEPLLVKLSQPTHLPNAYSHMTLSHLMFHAKKQVRQMTADTLNTLIHAHRLDDEKIAHHALMVIQKANIPFARVSDTMEQLADYGGLSGVCVRQMIAVMLAGLQVDKLPVGFKKMVELYYTLSSEQNSVPTDDMMVTLGQLAEQSSGLKPLVNKFKKLKEKS
ncbi:MAG: DUF6493 family protein [Moraxella sp.]|nr:DUF6493 family protein [Moraxella sp.]